MARRQAPQPPSLKAQAKAFYKMTGGRPWRGVRIADRPPVMHSDLRYYLELELAARGEEEHHRKGAPAKLERAIRATVWLDHHGLAVSDAQGSRCVSSLMRFLEHEAANTNTGRGPKALETARQLAGTLLDYEKPILLESSLPREEPQWPVLHSYRGLSLPLKL